MVTFKARAKGAAAGLVLLAILVGWPLALLAVGAKPIPDGTPDLGRLWSSLQRPDDGTLALQVFVVLTWIAWAIFAVAILVEVTARLRGVRAPQLPGLRLPQAGARALVSVAALLFLAAPLAAGTTVQRAEAMPVVGTTGGAVNLQALAGAAEMVASPHVEANGVHVGVLGETSSATSAAGIEQSAARLDQTVGADRSATYVTEEGDNLWSLAERYLGDGHRYPEIVDLNRALIGDNPGYLEPGWSLRLPADAVMPEEADASVHAGATRTYEVRPGDTLSEIAEDKLGDADAYPEIFEASVSTVQPGGAHLRDPDLILPGWKVTIAGGATDTTPPAAVDPPTQPVVPTSPHDEVPSDRTGPPAELPTQSPDEPKKTEAADPPAASASHTEERDLLGAPWIIGGLIGGGALLSAALLVRLRIRRREQSRAWMPGRALPRPEADLVPVEKTITAAGAPIADELEYLDYVLRNLANDLVASGATLPTLAAVELSSERIVLHLADPLDLPAPWISIPDRLRWALPTDTVPADAPTRADRPAPYPLLATIGRDVDQHWWLLNCEHLGTLTVTGDHDRAANLVRSMAAELALSLWGDVATIDCVGLGEEVASLDPTRVTYRPHDEATDASEQLILDALAMIDRTDANSTDVATGRVAQPDEEEWPARLLVVDANVEQSETVEKLIEVIRERPGHTAAGLIVTGEHAPDAGFALVLGDDGMLRLPHNGIMLTPVQLTADEAEGCARLYAQALDVRNVDVPVDDSATEGWAAYTDVTGAIRSEYTIPRDPDASSLYAVRPVVQDEDRTIEETEALAKARLRSVELGVLKESADVEESGFTPEHEGSEFVDPISHVMAGSTSNADGAHMVDEEEAASVLAAPDKAYVDTRAATLEDLQNLAPKVPTEVRKAVAEADPTLDEDFEAWINNDPSRPRLRVLGPMKVTAHGDYLSVMPRVTFYTELVAYLTTKCRHGATIDDVCEAFGLKPGRVRTDINKIRNWLGTNARTGEKILPNAPDAPAKREHGKNVYQIDTACGGLLIDADLFLRKTARGNTRGTDGVEQDLQQALLLVAGEPYASISKGGSSWQCEGGYEQHNLTLAIADVVHIVALHHLERGNAAQARAAVEIGFLALPQEESMWLLLAAVAEAEGQTQEAERIRRENVADRSDDGLPPLELSARTAKILKNYRWRATG